MENVEVVALSFNGESTQVLEFILNNYKKHSISSWARISQNMPVKIIKDLYHLRHLQNQNHLEAIEYLHLAFYGQDDFKYGWDNYKEIFDQCINLKEIEFRYGSNIHFVDAYLPNLPESRKQIWTERISYFENRGIRFVKNGAIKGNDNLIFQLAKEEGLSWISF